MFAFTIWTIYLCKQVVTHGDVFQRIGTPIVIDYILHPKTCVPAVIPKSYRVSLWVNVAGQQQSLVLKVPIGNRAAAYFKAVDILGSIRVNHSAAGIAPVVAEA